MTGVLNCACGMCACGGTSTRTWRHHCCHNKCWNRKLNHRQHLAVDGGDLRCGQLRVVDAQVGDGAGVEAVFVQVGARAQRDGRVRRNPQRVAARNVHGRAVGACAQGLDRVIICLYSVMQASWARPRESAAVRRS